MNDINSSHENSIARSIKELRLPESKQRDALNVLALVETLIGPFFGKPEAKAVATKKPAIKPVLKVQ